MNYEKALASGEMSQKWRGAKVRFCKLCGEEKPIQEFDWIRYYDYGVIPIGCHSCENTKSRNYRRQLVVKTIQKYGGVCAVCGGSDLTKLRICLASTDRIISRSALSAYLAKKKAGSLEDDLVIKCKTCRSVYK